MQVSPQMLMHSDGIEDQAGKTADSITLSNLAHLELREFKKRSIRPIIKIIKKAHKKPESFRFQHISDHANTIKNTLDKNPRLTSNLLIGTRDALIQTYLAAFTPLRDNPQFSTDEVKGESDAMQALKRIIYRLRHNNRPGHQVSVNLSYLSNKDAKLVFSALDEHTLTISIKPTPISNSDDLIPEINQMAQRTDSGFISGATSLTPTPIPTPTIRNQSNVENPVRFGYSLFALRKARRVAPTPYTPPQPGTAADNKDLTNETKGFNLSISHV